MAASMEKKIWQIFRIFSLFLTILAFSRARNSFLNETRCNSYLKVHWTSEFSHAPFVSAPLLSDVNGDGQIDVIGATFTETVKAVNGRTGDILPNLNWPTHLHDTSTYSSPIEYDIDQDGMLDVLVFTADGEILPYKLDGTLITNKVFKLPPIYIKKDWHDHVVSADHQNIEKYVKMRIEPHQLWKEYIRADPHILSSPIITDLNQDNQPDQLIIPVNYYIDKETFVTSEDSEIESTGLKYGELETYLLCSILVYNMTDYTVLRDLHLHLTKTTSEYPAFLLSTPTIVDLDHKGGPPEVIVATSAGSLIVYDHQWNHRPGFPISYDVLHGKVATADVNHNGDLELIVIDNSAKVTSLQQDGKVLWEAEISGTSSSGAVFGDIDGNDVLDLIITTNDGKIWALQGHTGQVLPGWPISVGGRLTANALLTKLGQKVRGLFVVVLSDDGHLHIISGNGLCREAFHVGESSFIPLTVVPSGRSDASLLIGTKDGSIMSVGIYNTSVRMEVKETFGSRIHHDLHEFLVRISGETKSQVDISSSWFQMSFIIKDTTVNHVPHKSYQVKVYIGSELVATSIYDNPGEYTLDIPAVNRPLQGHVILTVTNVYGVVVTDKYIARFNFNFQSDLQWLLATPFIINLIVLLFAYGFPTSDYLPVLNRVQNKSR